jgi:hypothetical protein
MKIKGEVEIQVSSSLVTYNLDAPHSFLFACFALFCFDSHFLLLSLSHCVNVVFIFSAILLFFSFLSVSLVGTYAANT